MEQKSLINLEFDKILKIIAGYAGSVAAKETILALHPTTDRQKILADLAEVDEFLDYSQAGVKINLGGIRDLREILDLLDTGSCILGSDDFLKVKADIEVAVNLKKVFESSDSAYVVKGGNRISERIRRIPSLKHVWQRIDDCLDDRGNLRNDASPALASIRRDYSQTVSNIEKQLNAFIQQHIDDVQDKFFTIRNERYVVPVQASAQNRIQGIVHDQSSTGQTVFIEPLSFLPMNNRLAQLRLSEKEEIKRIFQALTSLMYQSLSPIRETFAVLTWLDTVRARAEFAVHYQASRPELVDKSELKLASARHPLIHPDCVPLDISLSKDQSSVIITGPNGGGKTVALKTVGISALLMQTGNFVLASPGATLPVFDEIFADIGENQSIEDHLSTFTSHLKRLKEILDADAGRWLVLIDEICVGTDPAEGGALASGFLKELHRRGAFSIVTSHYDSLKHFAFVTPGFINAAMEFDYETFRPTFRFQMGLPGRSNALAMARAFSLPETVLNDLVLLNDGEKKEEKGLIEAIERERFRAESLRRTYVKKINELRSRETEVEESLKQLREFRKTKRDKLTEEFTVEYRQKLRELEKLICQLKASAVKNEESDLNLARSALSDVKKSIENLNASQNQTPDFEEEDSGEFSVNDQVVWKRNMSIGRVVRLKAGRGLIEVDFEGKLLVVPQRELSSKLKNIKLEPADLSPGGSVYAARKPVNSSVDLRGMRVEEALEAVESYLKTVCDSGLPKVYLIHGKGTGALQKAVLEYLRASPYRKKFRPGKYGEGDLGVTVVVFNEQADEQEQREKLESERNPRHRPKSPPPRKSRKD
ncbi:MAG: endonuclease MutS2 [Candidatus Rifleibacteriota bacterium]